MVLSLVGNKADLQNKRKVSTEEAAQYAASIGGAYYEVSALQDIGMVKKLQFRLKKKLSCNVYFSCLLSGINILSNYAY